MADGNNTNQIVSQGYLQNPEYRKLVDIGKKLSAGRCSKRLLASFIVSVWLQGVKSCLEFEFVKVQCTEILHAFGDLLAETPVSTAAPQKTFGI